MYVYIYIFFPFLFSLSLFFFFFFLFFFSSIQNFCKFFKNFLSSHLRARAVIDQPRKHMAVIIEPKLFHELAKDSSHPLEKFCKQGQVQAFVSPCKASSIYTEPQLGLPCPGSITPRYRFFSTHVENPSNPPGASALLVHSTWVELTWTWG